MQALMRADDVVQYHGHRPIRRVSSSTCSLQSLVDWSTYGASMLRLPRGCGGRGLGLLTRIGRPFIGRLK